MSRIVGGLSKASVNVAVAVATDVYPPEQRGKAMALIGICYSVGFLIGPSIGAYFAMQVDLKHCDWEENSYFYRRVLKLCLTLTSLNVLLYSLSE